MPLFEVGKDELIQLRQVQAGPELYEDEIEALLWSNLDSFVGVSLFPVATQPTVGDGLRPDIIALDGEGHVHVIEVKRDVDRGQLAQSLEYAGWARTTNLDELAGMFHGGAEAFFAAWAEFTETATPRLVRRPPQLVLVARAFDDRTDAALSFLTENGLPVTVLPVTIYEDQDGTRFIDVDADHEIEPPDHMEGSGGRSRRLLIYWRGFPRVGGVRAGRCGHAGCVVAGSWVFGRGWAGGSSGGRWVGASFFG